MPTNKRHGRKGRPSTLLRSFNCQDSVLCRDFTSNKSKWVPARIKAKTGPLSYTGILSNGRVVCQHIDQLISRVNTDHDDDDFHLDTTHSTISVNQSNKLQQLLHGRSNQERQSPDRFDTCQYGRKL